MVNSCICIYIYIAFSFLWNYDYFTLVILYIIMDAICLQGIDGSRAFVVFIQIAKCTDHRARTMGHAGSEYVFCLKCFHCGVNFGVLGLLQPVTPGKPLSRPHWPASGAFGLPPSQGTKWRWSDHCFHQRRSAISSTHLNDQWRISIYIFT